MTAERARLAVERVRNEIALHADSTDPTDFLSFLGDVVIVCDALDAAERDLTASRLQARIEREQKQAAHDRADVAERERDIARKCIVWERAVPPGTIDVPVSQARYDRLALKVEQYQRQLDDRWAGVVGVTNDAVAALTRADALATAVEALEEQAVVDEWRMPSRWGAVLQALRPYRAARPSPAWPTATGRAGCCTGINGSHTVRCPAADDLDRLTCWCCGGTFPSDWAALWSQNGARCFLCEGHTLSCRGQVGRPIDNPE